jgi:putative chitinase
MQVLVREIIMVAITEKQLRLLAPNARSSYRDAFNTADQDLAPHGVNKTALRLAHFMAQVLHETGGLTILVENMNYRAERLMQVWPKRFPTLASAKPFAHNPEALANHVYGGRMGNVKKGDGWRFVGRGMLQITGRESYEKYGKALKIDLAGNPDLAVDSKWALKIAAAEWNASGCNPLADDDKLKAVTFAINGGYNGLASRKEWLAKTKNVWK